MFPRVTVEDFHVRRIRTNPRLLGPTGTLCCALALGAGGCAEYRASPASTEAISRALAPLESAALAEEAARLRHPALPPVQIPPDGALTPRAAAVVAVLQSPTLRAVRDRHQVA